MSTYTKQDVAATIDHAVLKPEFTDADLAQHAAMCIENGVFSMCVKPCDVKTAAALLKDSPVKVSCVLSFPHGADTTATKVFQAQQAIEDGVDEIDMVMNIGKFMSGDFDYVKNDIQAVVELAHQHQVLVKVIQESRKVATSQTIKSPRHVSLLIKQVLTLSKPQPALVRDPLPLNPLVSWSKPWATKCKSRPPVASAHGTKPLPIWNRV